MKDPGGQYGPTLTTHEQQERSNLISFTLSSRILKVGTKT
jgi:hypothetical protein